MPTSSKRSDTGTDPGAVQWGYLPVGRLACDGRERSLTRRIESRNRPPSFETRVDLGGITLASGKGEKDSSHISPCRPVVGGVLLGSRRTSTNNPVEEKRSDLLVSRKLEGVSRIKGSEISKDDER